MNMKLLIGAIIVALCAIPSGASANGKGYSGTHCRGIHSASGGFLVWPEGLFHSPDIEARRIICPFIQDEVFNSTGTGAIWVHWTGTGFLRCVFNSINIDGSLRETSVGIDWDGGLLQIPRIRSDHPYGSYNMACNLPPRATLNTIFIYEMPY
jgi:hypothetical protein